MLRSVGQLLHGFRVEDGDEAAADSATGTVAAADCKSPLQEALVALGGRVGVMEEDTDKTMEDAEGEEGEAEEFVPSAFHELPTWMKLSLLNAMCDALLQTDEYREELKARQEVPAAAAALLPPLPAGACSRLFCLALGMCSCVSTRNARRARLRSPGRRGRRRQQRLSQL